MVRVLAGICVVLAAAAADGQIRSRALVLITPNGSSIDHINDNASTGGDGTTSYTDGVMTRANLYRGFSLPAAMCSATNYDGVNSRMYAEKAAFTSALNAITNVDWGLIRFTGTDCAFSATFTPRACSSNSTCASANCDASKCVCATDDQCNANEFCVSGHCGTDPNLCYTNVMGATDQRGGLACANRTDLPASHKGLCGTALAAGNASCRMLLGCQSDAECGGAVGSCALYQGGPARVCTCGSCPVNYGCNTGLCVYSLPCEVDGGQVLVSPSPSAAPLILPYLDNVEDYRDDGTGKPINPELHPVGNTPLASSIRTATDWYQAAVAIDPDAPCRPYALIVFTNGLDTCTMGDTDAEPVAAVRNFVASTRTGVRTLNRVYVISVALSPVNPVLNLMAQAGGTGSAYVINSGSPLSTIAAQLAPVTGVHVCGSSCFADTDVLACGTGCAPCPTPTNGTPTCDGTSCGIACNPGYHACVGACVDDNSVDHCGTLCTPCPTPPHGVAACTGTACTSTCVSDGDCDPSANPCEVPSCQGGICRQLNRCDLASLVDLAGADLAGADLAVAPESDLSASAPIPIPLFPPGHQPGGCACDASGTAGGESALTLLVALVLAASRRFRNAVFSGAWWRRRGRR